MNIRASINIRFALLFIMPLWLASCAHSSTLIVSIEELSCTSCVDPVAEKLVSTPGITEVQFDKKKVELVIRFDEKKISPEEILETGATGTELNLKLGAGFGSYPDHPTFAPGSDVKTIVKQGEFVDLNDHIISGKVTIFDFYAVWCGPCRRLSNYLDEVLRTNKNLAVRRIDIVDWDSPVAQKYLSEASELPHVIVYNAQGNEVGTVSGFKPEELDQLIEKAEEN